jgi:hypothetical protein
MQVTDSGAYGALAIYSDYGSSDLVTVNTNVLSKCRIQNFGEFRQKVPFEGRRKD